MVSLVDVVGNATSTSKVKVRGHDIPVHGLSLKAVASLIATFPLVKDLFNGKSESVNFSIESMITSAPGLVSLVIAEGTDGDTSPEAIAAIESLTIDEQADLFGAVLDATMPNGIVPFVAKVRKLLGTVAGEVTEGPGSSGQKGPKS